MSQIMSTPTSGKQLVAPVLSGNAPENQALLNLSLVLLEIAEKPQSSAIKTESQNQFDVEDGVFGKTD